ncbi:16S rRNA (adenine(1518)-N(6)/adenine(1519)-N(6))-dimethyltransferase RsmA [Blattabacterium cuenoti]|uniref:16S rRNA (adenine(1518)-N(6)/adenine(1519)-N(6))- dimethyltransferase RsmA n=1 Tax=Blattabacterium cuenoti TaxID=1653831 RepID=UPI00163CDE4F|nr:16S rRNA (adenine(1518)-N(6)/adenine(1519)-N(6))-dimethyltransferase RsmA [Blattabacterium cuenoti]
MYKSVSKKKLGQYFLKDENIARKIVGNLSFKNYNTVVEIGPGFGILTKYILKNTLLTKLFLIEIDKKLVKYLYNIFPFFKERKKKIIINKNFLKWNPKNFNLKNFAVIGNFPYNISSEILFHILKYYNYIPECIGMFQKELVKKILSHKGDKMYGILPVLIKTFYDVKYLFTVKKNVFSPMPNVKSAVFSLKRKKTNIIFSTLRKELHFKCVKTAFNQRRKKLKNSLNTFSYILDFNKIPFLNKRAEELSVKDFIELTKEIEIRT